MKSCFNSPMRITQFFANDFYVNSKGIIISKARYDALIDQDIKKQYNLYYKSMGIFGHDGIDCISTNDDLSINTVFGGMVMIKMFHNVYGNRIAIWNEKTLMTEYHNHLSQFFPEIAVGKTLRPGEKIGIMGNTGKVFGGHNHFAIARTDGNGNRIARDNGYFGYIDPVPFLIKED